MLVLDAQMAEATADIRKMAGRIGDMTPVARDFGAHMVRTWSLKFPATAGHEAGPAGGPPAIQSGEGKASLHFEVRSGGDVLEAGTAEKHMLMQHFGGTIRPVRAKALTVPIHERSYGKRARDFSGLFRIPPGEGEEPEDLGILAQRTAGGDLVPLFALRGSVRLPARPWLLVYPDDWDYLGESMERHVEGTA